MKTISVTLKLAIQQLRAAGVPNDLLDAQTLLAAALGKDRTYLIINFSEQLTSEALEKYQALIDRRATGEPLQYITGRQEFFGLEFMVTPDVLIPRPETELLVEETLRLAQGINQPLIIDVGTGSGCIAISLARELEGAKVIATDISAGALRVARGNAQKHELQNEVAFIEGDLFSGIEAGTKADLIVSNPPYIAAAEIPALQREVRDWEPKTALTDFGDGLEFYRRLLLEAPAYLKSGGHFICEMGYDQSEKIQALVDRKIWNAPTILLDLQGIERVMVVSLQ